MEHQEYKIIWHSKRYGEEVIDSCDSLAEAEQLLEEYKDMLKGKIEIRKGDTQ
tara:strand:- start:235 stop:393 length:159 start_codon:yes stop_codon:yes gene_type:complete